MRRVACCVCKREQDRDIPTIAGEGISDTYCMKCFIADGRDLRVPLGDLLDSSKKDDPAVVDAIDFLKDGIRNEIKNNIHWVGLSPVKYSDEVNALYDRISREVESEIIGETEMGPNAKR